MCPSADIYSLTDVEIMKKIGEKMKRIRLNDNISQSELQEITGLSRKTIGEAESDCKITLATLIAMIRGLNMLDLLNPLIKKEEISPLLLSKQDNMMRVGRKRK